MSRETKVYRYGILYFFQDKKCMILKTTFIQDRKYNIGSIAFVDLKDEKNLKAEIIDLHVDLITMSYVECAVSQHDVSADMHLLHNIMLRNLYAVTLPTGLVSMQSRYTGILEKLLRKKSNLQKNLIDRVSLNILEDENILKEVKNSLPVVNTGGGDCFYKSLSIHFFGNEELSSILRLLASIELFANFKIYIKYFSDLWVHLGLGDREIVNFQYILSNKSSDKISDKSDYEFAMKHESMLNATGGKWASFVFLPVMSKILACSIKLIYGKPANKFFYETFSRSYCLGSKIPEVILMYTKTHINKSEPNHFVCCIPKSRVSYITSVDEEKTLEEEAFDIGRKIVSLKQNKINFPIKRVKTSSNQGEPSNPSSNQDIISSDDSNNILSSDTISTSVAKIPKNISTVFGQTAYTISTATSKTAFVRPGKRSCGTGLYNYFKKPKTDSIKTAEVLEVPASSCLNSERSCETGLIDYSKPKTDDIKTTGVLGVQASSDLNILELDTNTNNSKPSVKLMGCKLDHCLSCGEIKIPRGNPVVGIEKCDKEDFGLHYKNLSKLSRAERISLASNVWKPDSGFQFPSHFACNKHIRMSYDFLDPDSDKYIEWLVYSQYLDGCFCLYCSLFGQFEVDFNKKLESLVRKPFLNWIVRARNFKNHGSSPSHILSVGIYKTIMSQIKGKSQGIDEANEKKILTIYNSNYTKIKPMMKTIIHCGHYNLPIRGHRDDAKYIKDPNFNAGVYQGLLELRIDAGDKILEEHFKTAPKNKTQRSKTVQNQMIGTCKKYIQSKIIQKIKRVKFFAIIADEATDISNKTQLSIVLRYVDPDTFDICEDFFAFLECIHGTSGAALATIIEEELKKAGLDLNYCRGQCYDGAGSMRGKRKGLSSLMTQRYPKIIFFHCAGHKLNLCVGLACSLPHVQRTMGAIRKATEIFQNSPKKTTLYKNVIETSNSTLKPEKLLNVCRTRWLERIKGMERILKYLRYILMALKLIASDYDETYSDSHTQADARGQYQSMKRFEFIITLVIVRKLLAFVYSLTYEVQRVKLDVVRLFEAVNVVIETLQDVSKNLDKHHHEWYVESTKIASTAGVKIKPKRCYNNSVEEYYKINVSRPFLDHIINSLRDRFSDDHKIYFFGSFILPNFVLDKKHDSKWMQHVTEFAEQYTSDLPNPFVLKEELVSWKAFWKEELEKGEIIPSTIQDTLIYIKKRVNWFPNIKTILILIATCPGTSVTSERSFSKLRLLKTYIRNSMGNSRLTGLALLNIHRNIGLDMDELMDLFCRDYKKTLYMRNILNDEIFEVEEESDVSYEDSCDED